MKAEIRKKIALKDIPSASGIEIANDNIYIIGDDSPYLYHLDKEYNLLEKIELFQSDNFSTGRIPKSIKADLECSTIINYQNQDYILLGGSGSKENRNKGYLFNLSTKEIKDFSLKNIYHIFKTISDNQNLINVEAMCSDNEYIYFFNRANKNGINIILKIDINNLFDYLFNKKETIEKYYISGCQLPDINHINSGFSGATIYEKQIFFTASVEDTDNAIDDGEILGSFIGILEYNKSLIIKKCTNICENTDTFLGKVESISALSHDNNDENKFIFLAVTDNDTGPSELLEIVLET